MSNMCLDFNKYGGSYLVDNKNYALYIEGKDTIGRPDGQFMIPSNQMDDLLNNYPNSPREWEKQLGLPENSLGDSDIHRVDVFNLQDYDPRLPTSNLSGVNDNFLEGMGKVPGGQDECVVNPFPNPETSPKVGKITILNLSGQIQNDTFASNDLSNQFNPSNYIPPYTSEPNVGIGIGNGFE